MGGSSSAGTATARPVRRAEKPDEIQWLTPEEWDAFNPSAQTVPNSTAFYYALKQKAAAKIDFVPEGGLRTEFGTPPRLTGIVYNRISDLKLQRTRDVPESEKSVGAQIDGYDITIKHSYGRGPATYSPKIVDTIDGWKLTPASTFATMAEARSWTTSVFVRLSREEARYGW